MNFDTAASLRRARWLAARGRRAEARETYLEVLKHNADCLEALIELGAVAAADDYRQAARSAFSRALEIDPGNPTVLCGLGNLCTEEEDFQTAKAHFRAALAKDARFVLAHQGLARCLTALDEAGAEPHWQAGFSGRASMALQPAEDDPRLPVLLLVSARGGNTPIKQWIDPELFSIVAVYADFVDAAAPVPRHALTVNAVGDAELCGDAIEQACAIVARDDAPLINHPEQVKRTSREENAVRLRAIPNVVTPRVARVRREALRAEEMEFPVLLRSPGFHTGKNFVLVEQAAALADAAAALPGETLLAIEYLDARGADGLARKYRAMFIDGRIYPLHMAASTDWKVHYFSSAMAEHSRLRAEEQRFLEDMPGVLGSKAMAALHGIEAALGLDYAGVDFALAADGSVIMFEANATMIMLEPDKSAIWDYRRQPIAAAHDAAKAMLRRRVEETRPAGSRMSL